MTVGIYGGAAYLGPLVNNKSILVFDASFEFVGNLIGLRPL